VSFTRGFLAARSHLAFLLGLALALGVVWLVNRSMPQAQGGSPKDPATVTPAFTQALALPKDSLPLRPPSAELTPRERRWAEAAWSYFQNNTRPETGLADSVKGYPSTTLWDTGSQLMGILSAEELGLVSAEESSKLLSRALTSLERMPLCEGKLPNRAYDTRTLVMVDYTNKPITQCLGWSALDVARIGVPFSVLVWRKPELTAQVRRITAAWKLEAAAGNGVLVGTSRTKAGALEPLQEGRFGYEQYGAKSLLLLGLDVAEALDYGAHVAFTPVSGQPIAHDRRMPAQYGGTHNAVLSEPYVLEGAEFGFDSVTLPVSRALLLAQRKRFEATGKLTAVSEDHLDKAPHFVYSSVLSGGVPWAVFTPEAVPAEAFRTLSTKAALGWGVLFEGAYPDRLLESLDAVVEPGQGLYAGIYESDGSVNRALTANTNGIVLELLAYRLRGPWLRAARMAPAGEGSR
jgi:hypothetical protein